MESTIYLLGADLLVTTHFLYVAFVVAGEAAILLGWHRNWVWVRNLLFRTVHFVAILIVAVQAVLRIPCPLTVWEYRLREMAGQTADWELSFVARLFRRIVFHPLPDWFFLLLYIGFGALVLITLFLVPPDKPPRKKEEKRSP